MRTLLTLTALLLCGTIASAQEPAENHPGYFPIDELGIADPDGSSVDINLRGAMLRLVGAAVLTEEPELGALVSQMQAMRVLVVPIEGPASGKALAGLERGVAKLEALGWQRTVRVKEDDEQVHLYLQEIEGVIEGLTLFVFEQGDEMTLINIAGRIDVELLGAISRAFDVPTLERALEQGPPVVIQPNGKDGGR